MSRSNISPLIKAQVEKLAAAGGGITSGRRVISSLSSSSSSTIIMATKPVHANVSSYVSGSDSMSSTDEMALPSLPDADDELHTSFPTLPPISQRLEHSAARDRIAVKNRPRQATKPKLVAVRETDDSHTELFCSTAVHEQTASLPSAEPKAQPQVVVHLAELDQVRARLRGHSADKTLSTTNTTSIQRSISCKRPQEVKIISRSRRRSSEEDDDDDDDDDEHESRQQQSSSRSPPEEHIYDNFDLFKQGKVANPSSEEPASNERQPFAQLREQPTFQKARLRPVTVFIPSRNSQPTVNEFESVFHQMKQRSMSKKDLAREPSFVEPEVTIVAATASIEEPAITLPPIKNESTQQTNGPAVDPGPNRRRTMIGMHLPANNKVVPTETPPELSWIDMAKQKQNRLQAVSSDKPQPDGSDPQQSSMIEPTVISRKHIVLTSNLAVVSSDASDDTRRHRKSMFEPAPLRQLSPSTALERDSIRAMKAEKPNRINNLIQLFDK